MKRAFRLIRAFALAGLVCVGVVALGICFTLSVSGRSFSLFLHMVLDLGLFACALLFGAIVIVYPLIALAAGFVRARSSGWIIVQGAMLGITAFAVRLFILRDTEDPDTVSAYLAFLARSPWEIAGLLPFVLGGVTFAFLAQRVTRHDSEAAKR